MLLLQNGREALCERAIHWQLAIPANRVRARADHSPGLHPPNGPLAKLQAGSHAKATRRVAGRDQGHVGRSDLQAT
jgi:hypothetical protein